MTSTLTPFAACGDGGGGRPNGDSCEDSSECGSGLCYENRCLDPEGDEDGDGLVNRIEATLGSNSRAADTDGDGKLDPDELESDRSPRDTDGDGKPDIVESTVADADRDCRPDETDSDDAVADGNLPELVAAACPTQGVCSAEGATLAVACPKDLQTPVCEFSGVPGHEAPEASCDGRDNDCDGTTDTHCDSLLVGLVGHWKLDGDGQDSGPHADHGTVVGATPAPDRFGGSGKAMRFAAAGDRIDVPATEHPIGTATVTYSVWIRPDLSPDPWAEQRTGIFSFGDVLETNRRSGLIQHPGLGCAGYIGEMNDVNASRACAPGGHWSHFVVVKDGLDVQFFLDGRPADAGATVAGQDLVSTKLVIGLSKVLEDGIYEQFSGYIDDLRVWNRALTQEELTRLHREGDWPEAGTPERPAAHCLHVRDAAGATTDGPRHLDVDGDGPAQPFTAWCDMTTEGGGWTLAWVYGFTSFDAFTADGNAVTPVPSWPFAYEGLGVPVSTVPPTNATTAGAIDFAHWKRLGREFMARSPLTVDVVCEQGAGSIADMIGGHIGCRTIEPSTEACEAVAPNQLGFGPGGPQLVAGDLVWYWDASTTTNWPTHDPCGTNQTNHDTTASFKGGSLWLRPSTRPMNWPTQCDRIQQPNRRNGLHTIDPDGTGGAAPFEAECLFGIDWGGWTRVSPKVLDAMKTRGAEPRQFLYQKNDRFYRSPMTRSVWAEDAYGEAPGNWVWRGVDGSSGAFECAGGSPGTLGVGCGTPGTGSDGQPYPRVIPADGFDADNGSGAVCQSPPNIFSAPSNQCAADVGIWVRASECMPDEGSIIGDGGFGQIDMSGEWATSPCWWAFGPNNWFRDYELDMQEVRPGGTAPSLKATNPTLGNEIYHLNLVQTRISMVANRSYTFSFWAKSAETRNMRVFVQPRSLEEGIFWEDITVTPEWRRYDLGFATRRAYWDVQIDFQMAEFSTAPIWLDDVRLSDDGPSPCGPQGDGNLLGNGDFSSGTTCWRHGQFSAAQPFSFFDVQSTGGPNGAPRAVLEKRGVASEDWHQSLLYPRVALQSNRRYALSYDAKASTDGRFFVNLNRWDLGVQPWYNTEQPVSTAWRNYRHDFVTGDGVPADGVQLEIATGRFPVGTLEFANIRLVDLGPAPCTLADGPFVDPGFDYGMACWFALWHWDELNVYAEIDATEPGRPMRFEISDNAGEFQHTARLEAIGIQVEANHGYLLRFRGKAQSNREGYTNINEWYENEPHLFLANTGFRWYTTWQNYEIPLLIGDRGSRPSGSKFEIGFGGATATGYTWIDDVTITDAGLNPCATSGNNRISNGSFQHGRLCWEYYFDTQNVRANALSDTNVFVTSAPSMRLENAVTTEPWQVNLVQNNRTLADGTWRITFRARAATSRNMSVFVADDNTGLTYREFSLSTDWTLYSHDFAVQNAIVGGVRIELQAGGASGSTVWLDDVSLVPAP